MIHKPELCAFCAAGEPNCFCDQWPFTCKKQLALFLAGYEAARQQSFREGFDTAIDETAVDYAALDTIPCPEGP